IGGDDATYVLQAHSLIANGMLPIGFKSPGYPSILALVMLLTGMHIVLLKFSSVLFYLGSLVSFFYVFRKRLEPMLFASVFVLFALSTLVLDYSHQTYSEMLFLLIELWTIHFVWREQESTEFSVSTVFLIALFSMAGFYVRAIGATLPISIGLWYIFRKKWKTLAILIGFCVLLYIPWKVEEFTHGIVVMGQASDVMMVNPYNPAMGRESIGGFAQRFVSNMFVHLNYMFPRALSLPYGEDLVMADARLLPTGMAFLGVLFSTILIVGLVRALRRESLHLRFLAVYFVVYCVSIWLALQTFFATPRMMVPVMPILLLMFLVGISASLHKLLGTAQNRTSTFKKGFVFLASLMLISSVVTVGNAVNANVPVLQANLRGDEFAGFSTDWTNYLKACEWIAGNLPKDSTGVICRKPELFQIYTGGYNAYGTYTIESTNPDSIVNHWRAWKMTHLLYDNFQWSSTLRRYVQPVGDKYPTMFKLIHQDGTTEPSFVYRLDYAVVDSARAAGAKAK
ncbi:MAG TPA: hypothetical protein VFO86_01455, partial [Terriglobia bacterium]|nr:hypothetical protein [Terriglobia bacterium]